MKKTDFDFDFELFFELSPDLLCIAGFDGYFKKVNPSVSKLLEYSMEELYSRPINDFVHPNDLGLTKLSRENVKNSNTLTYFENRYITKSGNTVWLSWTAHSFERDKLIFAIAKNITHKKNLESERTELVQNLTSINRELKQLNLTTSHDLRSPLSSLMGVFELLDLSKIDDKETVDLIKILKMTGENLIQSLNNYLDLMSVEIEQTIKPEKVNVEECLNKVLHLLSSMTKTSNVTIHTDFSDFKEFYFNNSYMESVFMNLITNSIKFSKPAQPIHITIRTEHSDGLKHLIFEDNGLGFDMNRTKDKIFKLHQTFHDRQDSKGVGLYLVHSYITNLGGTIDVESEVNKGTRFTISFPE